MTEIPRDALPVTESVQVTLPISADQIEALATATQGRSLRAIELIDAGVADGASFSFGGDTRLLGWLARHNLARRRPDLELPRNAGTQGLPRGATSQLSYFVLSRLSRHVVQYGNDLTSDLLKAQSKALIVNDGGLRTPTTRAYFYDDQMPGLPMLPALDPPPTEPHSRQVGHLLINDLAEMGLTTRAAGAPDPGLIHPIRDFVAETLENARKHAVRDLNNQRIKGLAMLAIRRFMFRDQNDRLPAAGTPLSDYFATLRRDLGHDLDSVQFVEFSVADSGIGIPAHFGSRLNVYVEDFDQEVSLLRAAFRMSEEERAIDGVGLYKVQEAARDLRGFLSIRTGRVEASRHFLTDRDRDLLDLDIRPGARALLGGTALSLIVPWIQSGDRLPLDVD
jgi:hypothetical protein